MVGFRRAESLLWWRWLLLLLLLLCWRWYARSRRGGYTCEQILKSDSLQRGRWRRRRGLSRGRRS